VTLAGTMAYVVDDGPDNVRGGGLVAAA
jgi:hypothetical protein